MPFKHYKHCIVNDNIVLPPKSKSAVLMFSLAHSSIYQSHRINSTDFKKRSGESRTAWQI